MEIPKKKSATPKPRIFQEQEAEFLSHFLVRLVLSNTVIYQGLTLMSPLSEAADNELLLCQP